MPDLVSLGECMIEFFTDEPPETAANYRRAFGGDTFNLLVAAARLGTSVGFITGIAEDAFGRYLLRGWEGEGVNPSFVVRRGTFNGAYFIATRPDGEREFTYYRRGSAASQIQPSDLDLIDFTALRAFHTSGITQALSLSSRETAREGLSRAKAAGCITSFDLNFRPRLWDAETAQSALKEILPNVSVCFAGIPEDSSPLLDCSDLQETAFRLHEFGVPLVVVKGGMEGSWISQKGEMTHIPAQIFGEAVDTTGAGDAYAGAFLHGLLVGLSPEEAGRIGAVCAGLKVLGRGAIASMPSGDEIRRRL